MTHPVVDMIKNSGFNKAFYSVDTDLRFFMIQIMSYAQILIEGKHVDEVPREKVDYDLISGMVPVYQRANDKWSLPMKKSYVQNLLKGVRAPILLAMQQDSYKRLGYEGDCYILDGLQRTTAIKEFMQGQFSIFDDIDPIYYDDFERIKMPLRSTLIPIRIYRFNNMIEEVEFYIEMNENITHSADDISRAKNYLAELKGGTNDGT